MIENIKIIFIDVDGTLTNNRGEITEYTKKVINQVTSKGIYVVICSGRANYDLIEKSKKINASSIIISSKGTLIFDYNKNIKIYESKIDFKILKEIYKFSLKNNIELTFNTTYKRFKTFNSRKEASVISNLYELEENVTQIVAESNSYKSIKLLRNYILKYKSIQCSIPISQQDNNTTYYELDIYNIKNEKGKVIKILLDYLKLDKNNSMCIGDGMNDFSMFNACKYKVAMKNANNKLKDSANFITKYTNEEEGVARFINYIIEKNN